MFARYAVLDENNSLHQNQPMELVLFTERLKLTPFAEADVDIALAMFTDPEVQRYAGGVITAAEVHAELHKWVRRGGNGCIGIWCISDRVSGEKLGTAALLPMPIEEDDTDFDLVVAGEMPDGDVEIGFFLKQPAWGRGYATEAARRVIQMAFEDSPLTEVVATFEKGNTGSQQVLEKAGFVDRGTRRCYGEVGPDYRITRAAWLAAQQ